MDEIRGILRQKNICCGIDSDGIFSFLEISEGEPLYRLYRRDKHSVNDDYFIHFKDKQVTVVGVIQSENWIMVEQIILNNKSENSK